MTRVLNIAHRGARSLAPENTLAAARMAQQAGADMWELDVAVSADGALFVMHDDSLQRTSNAAQCFPDRAPWTFSGFTLAELERLDYGSWFSESDPFGEAAAGNVTPAGMAAFRGEPLLTLRAALHFTRCNAWQVNVEIKRLPAPLETFPVAAAVVGLVEELGMAHQVLVSSFVFDNLRAVHALNPAIRLAALTGLVETEPQLPDLPLFGVNPHYVGLADAAVRGLRGNNLAVVPWTVNAADEMQRLIDAGVSGIITDYPQRLQQILRG